MTVVAVRWLRVDLLQLVLPRRCVACRWPGADLCDACRARLHRLGEPLCDRCGAPTAWPVARCRECAGRRLAFVSARAAVAYDDTARAIVRGWKERGLRRLAAEAGSLVVEAVSKPAADALTWVPADGDRGGRRGYHPAAGLARELAHRWELDSRAFLVRTRSTRRQAGLPLAERRRNVARAFRAEGHVPRRVVLVDDVYTTGSTAAAAAAALRRGGARSVEVVTFARAIR